MGLFGRKQIEIAKDILEGVDLPRPIVDVGGRGKKSVTAALLGHHDFQTWDIAPGPDVDVVVDACDVNTVFWRAVGTFLSFSMIEHVRNPWAFAEQLYKLSKSGAHLFVVSPWMFPMHVDNSIGMGDYWRISVPGLRCLFSKWTEQSSGYFKAGEHEGSFFYGIADKLYGTR